MKSEDIYNAITEIDDRFIMEYQEKQRISSKKRWIKWLPAAACLVLVLSGVPIAVNYLLGGAHAEDPDWSPRHHQMSVRELWEECGDLPVVNLPLENTDEVSVSLGFDLDGRYKREKWNTLHLSVNYNNVMLEDVVWLEIYFPNNFKKSSLEKDNNYKVPIYNHYDVNNTVMELKGFCIPYSDLSENPGYLHPNPITDQEFDQLPDSQKESHMKFYTARFDFGGNNYVLSVHTRYREKPLEYYLNLLLPGSGSDGKEK